MDTLHILGLEISCQVGAYDWEKGITQTLFLDIELEINALNAAKQDNLSDALDYAELSEQLTEFVQGRHFNLIETLAEHCADFVLKRFNVPRIKLIIHKPTALITAKDVMISIERTG